MFPPNTDDGRIQTTSPSMPNVIGRGYALGMSVLSVSFLFVLCPIGGHWVDEQLGTGILFAAVGFALGLFVGIHQLIRLNR